MASIPKKTPTAGASTGRNSPGATSPSPAAGRRSGTGAAPSTPSNGIARARSVRTAANGSPVSSLRMAGAKKPVGASSELKNSTLADTTADADEDARMESSALMEDLKERLALSEQGLEEFKKQVEVLQSRLDEAIAEQGKLEDKLHEEEERVEGLEVEKRETVRQKREIEGIYEAERHASMKEREAMQGREEELQGIIERLKERGLQRDREEGRMSRTSMYFFVSL